jgi:hypothetical protein
MNQYGKMQDELEFKREKGLIYRKISPDNPFQMGASRRLNKSFDQSTNGHLANVDYVKNVFDNSEPAFSQKPSFGQQQATAPASKGMFVVKRPGSRQAGGQQASNVKIDSHFVKNAGKFFE